MLAAGRSRRMGARRKQLLPWGDSILLRAALQPFTTLSLQRLVVVMGDEAEVAAPYLADVDYQLRVNPNPDAGMGHSLALGAAALPAEADCFFVALGDMPLVRPATLRTLLQAFAETCRRGVAAPVIVPVFDGRRGHPVLFDGARRAALTGLQGDRGAKELLRQWGEAVVPCPVDDPGVVGDIDQPDDYRRLLAEAGII
ncbi:NTP transferase domain-containing protein [Acanthopleuribacter pedis]|uniref:Nucleotidyltransferase family protein n=1 Tax=Acanthopleuribacter pedis TaxID=442870 RepID=A0A8J7Q2P5_9BACT|nr:nucleotidyltransferase family protein [Acanthopleuribacter pedis]